MEEALSFFEENKVIYVEDGYNLNDDAVPQTISPYRLLLLFLLILNNELSSLFVNKSLYSCFGFSGGSQNN